MHMRSLWLFLPLLLVLSGCATRFTGSAMIEGGASGCLSKCQANGLVFAGMVFMGEYSEACMCVRTGAPGTATNTSNVSYLIGPAGAAAGGTVGVARQMQDEQHAHR